MTTLLISDLHLCEERPDITRTFLQFLQENAGQVQALYILGDLFEVWIGDDNMGLFEEEIASALRKTVEAGTAVYLMHGNRDFLIGKAFCRQSGCTLLTDPTIVTLGNARTILMHGDSLCTLDREYQRFRLRLRNPVSLWLLPRLPLSYRRKLARTYREGSHEKTRTKARRITDVTPDEVVRTLRRYQAPILIHGHTHRPGIHPLLVDDKPKQRIVLGDWEPNGQVLQIDYSGFHLRPALQSATTGETVSAN